MQLSHPLRGKFFMWPYLWLVRAVERRLLSRGRPVGGAVTFELMECRVKPCATDPPRLLSFSQETS